MVGKKYVELKTHLYLFLLELKTFPDYHLLHERRLIPFLERSSIHPYDVPNANILELFWW